MNDHVLKTLDALRRFHPIVLSTLILILQESSTTWELYRTAQRLAYEVPPNGPIALGPDVEGRREPTARWRRVARWVIAFGLSFAGIAAILLSPQYLEDEVQLRLINTIALVVPFAYAIHDNLECIVGVKQRKVARNEDGVPVVVFSEPTKMPAWLRAVSVFSSVAIALAALWPTDAHPFVIAIVYYSTLRLLVMRASVSHPKLEMKKTLISSLIFAVSPIALTVIYCLDQDWTGPLLSVLPRRNPAIVEWFALLISVLLSIFLVQIFGMLHRFGRASTDSLPSESSAAKTRLWDTLKEPYALVAFVVLSLSFVGVAVLDAYGLVSCTLENAIPTTIFVAVPAIAISSIAQALSRGHAKSLCSYVEDWSSPAASYPLSGFKPVVPAECSV